MEKAGKTARQLLDSKRSGMVGVVSVGPDDTVLNALEVMRANDIGAVVVIEGGKLKGMLSERDYARKVELEGKRAQDCLVHEVMTSRSLVYAKPGDSVEQCRALMIQHHVRHLPVTENGRVIGVLSIRDVLDQIIAEEEHVIRELETDRLMMTTDTGAY